MIPRKGLSYHRRPSSFLEKTAWGLARFLKTLADFWFQERYGHRVVFIETIAGIPGMIGGALLHLRCLRKIKEDEGWIRRLLEEAENERMHLMAFMEIAKPTRVEWALIYITQFFFGWFYFFLYVCSSPIAHRFVGYLEEEAIQSYSDYLERVLSGSLENVPAPAFGISYWKLKKNARLSDLIIAIREDERHHRDVNHHFSDVLKCE